MTLTLFSFGYYGWGNSTAQLVQVVDAVERAGGFAPPIFVDIRIRRSVRAKGFNGPAFEKLLGPDRHRWMRSLGNRRILSRRGPAVQIAQPEAVGELLDLALAQLKLRRRLVFFCGCAWPRDGGQVACHRCTVAGLLLREARHRGRNVTVAEWPGGIPSMVAFDVEGQGVAGRKTVPLGKAADLARIGAIAWGSRAKLRCAGQSLIRLVGPAARRRGEWVLPVLGECTADALLWREESTRLRMAYGLDPMVA